MAQRINQEQQTRPATEMRIEKAQYQTLTTIFTELMKKYNIVQTVYVENCKKRFKRQLEISINKIQNET
jgi:t-SNARE complex subunit (syntaxin)